LAPDGDNQEVRGRILSALRAQSSLASSTFEVNVTDSQIELSGSVPTAREKEIARRIAQSYGNNRGVAAAKIVVRNAAGAQASER
jgi:osmotically-inducible protein OsmY